jgi:hypothetical protein
MRQLERVGFTVAAVAAIGLELVAIAAWQGWAPKRTVVHPPMAQQHMAQPAPVVAAAAVAAPAPAPAADALVPASKPVLQARAVDTYYSKLRKQIRWVETRFGSEYMQTPDLNSRMLLAKSAARRAGLHEVGLGFQDVYGIINAETTWVPRMGASKDGTPNLGIAQFEPATARALGLRNPNDLVEAVHVAASHMKEAAEWSANRIARLKLDDDERARKLREGVSIYYNLSSRGRSVWNGRNTDRLPKETRYHIHNARLGARQAMLLDAQLNVGQRSHGRDSAVALAATEQNGG